MQQNFLLAMSGFIQNIETWLWINWISNIFSFKKKKNSRFYYDWFFVNWNMKHTHMTPSIKSVPFPGPIWALSSIDYWNDDFSRGRKKLQIEL